jgi:hypothetical protein
MRWPVRAFRRSHRLCHFARPLNRHHRAGAKRRDPVIPHRKAMRCPINRDGRDEPGHDKRTVSAKPLTCFRHFPQRFFYRQNSAANRSVRNIMYCSGIADFETDRSLIPVRISFMKSLIIKTRPPPTCGCCFPEPKTKSATCSISGKGLKALNNSGIYFRPASNFLRKRFSRLSQ